MWGFLSVSTFYFHRICNFVAVIIGAKDMTVLYVWHISLLGLNRETERWKTTTFHSNGLQPRTKTGPSHSNFSSPLCQECRPWHPVTWWPHSNSPTLLFSPRCLQYKDTNTYPLVRGLTCQRAKTPPMCSQTHVSWPCPINSVGTEGQT